MPAADRTATSRGRGPSSDEVDRIVAAWRRERPDLDVAPLEVLSRVTRLARHLDRDRAAAFSAQRPRAVGVRRPRRAAPVRARPTSSPPASCCAETLVTSGTMTNRIDRLERRGLVVRRPDPDDGRGVLVGLTTAGRTVVDAALAALLDRERALLADLDRRRPDGTLAGLLRRLVAPFDTPGLSRA